MSSYAITGTSRGLGFEFVKQLSLNASNKVFALARNPDTATNLQKLAAERANITVVWADVAIVEDLKAAAEKISNATGGTLDVFISNAVYIDSETMPFGPYDVEKDPEKMKKSMEKGMDANVWTLLRGTNIFLPLIQAGRQKKFIAISSGMADIGVITKTELAFGFPYCMQKAAVNVLMAKYAVQFKSEGVKFLSLSPGWVDTHEATENSQQMEAYLKQHFSLYKPDIEGKISPQESVRMCLEVIHNLSIEQSGAFLSHFGNQQWL